MTPLRLPFAILTVLAGVLALAACGQERRYGDQGGVPVAVSVQLDRAFVSEMANRQGQPSVGAGVGVGSGGYSGVGVGVGFTFSATEVYLLGGEGPIEAQVFRKELGWGDNRFDVPLAPGRKLFLSVKVEGGREGWESIGEITVPRGPSPRIAIALGAAGAKVSVEPVEVAVEPAPAATAAAVRPPPEPTHRAPVASATAAPPRAVDEAGSATSASATAAAPMAEPGRSATAGSATSAAVAPLDDAGATADPERVTGPGDADEPRLSDAPADGADRQAPKLIVEPTPPPPAVEPAKPYPDPALDP